MQKEHAEALKALARELRQSAGLGASLFQAAAARIGMTVTDIQVLDNLEGAGPVTAGQLADLTGLTTGAITGMLNRLEKAGLVRRERDPEDGRRVIVRLVGDMAGNDGQQKIGSMFASLGMAWDDAVSGYDDEQLGFLLAFLQRNNAITRQEIVRLREAPAQEEDIFSAPLGGLTSGRLMVSGAARLSVRADASMTAIYQARFEGTTPTVTANAGVVSIRYPRRLWMLSGGQHSMAEVTLNAAIPWQIGIQGGVAEINAELGALNLAGLEVKGGMSMVRLELSEPAGVVPIGLTGGASEILVRRPAGSAARVHLKGWVSTLVFDDQMFSNMGADVRLQSQNYDTAADRYDIEVSSSASTITITAG
ncbi:MAG: MarR family transcriptional regulator [Ktedonobacterales bacterium]